MCKPSKASTRPRTDELSRAARGQTAKALEPRAGTAPPLPPLPDAAFSSLAVLLMRLLDTAALARADADVTPAQRCTRVLAPAPTLVSLRLGKALARMGVAA